MQINKTNESKEANNHNKKEQSKEINFKNIAYLPQQYFSIVENNCVNFSELKLRKYLFLFL